jgi:hypothetical protein
MREKADPKSTATNKLLPHFFKLGDEIMNEAPSMVIA